MFFISSLLVTLLKDKYMVCRMSENCKSLVLQDKCNIELFLSLDAFTQIISDNFMVKSFSWIFLLFYPFHILSPTAYQILLLYVTS